MSLKDIDDLIKSDYYSANENLVEGFYNLALSETVKYDRLSGYFSSASLSVAAKGMKQLIENNGHIRLLCGVELSKDDWESISNPEQFKDLINKNFLDEYEDLEDELIWNYTKVLGWMIANDILEVKIGLNYLHGKYIPDEIFHPKLGIFHDEEDNCLIFVGSVNESARGWGVNSENLHTFKEWKSTEHIDTNISAFEDFWNDTNDNLKVFNVPDESIDFLIQNAPKDKVELEKTIVRIKQLENDNDEKKSKKTPRSYQLDAIDSWFSNDKRGIFAMATGTGKTYTALCCFDRLLYENNKLLTVIACPQLHLIDQWESAIRENGYVGKCIIASSNNKKWKRELKKTIADLMGSKKNAVVLTSFDMFSDEKFMNTINLYSDKSFVIVDEVHGIGSYKFRHGFLDVNYDYRLGLSATPEIEDDLERTDLVYENFGGIVFEYSLDKAIKEGFLTPYNYHPIFVDLTDKELKKYKELTRKIGNLLRKEKLKPNEEETLENHIRQRRNLINKAENKLKCLREFLDSHKDIKDLIVYGADKKHLKNIEDVLDEYDISNHRFTGDEDPPLRETILNLFSIRHYRALCAMKCLDEGVDVPSTQNAILLASTMNSRQHIQRRGRILRKHPGKEIANIYDFIVVPNLKNEPESVKNILKSEKKRYEEYVNSAWNRIDCRIKIANKWEEIL